jgi:hypothetical protein
MDSINMQRSVTFSFDQTLKGATGLFNLASARKMPEKSHADNSNKLDSDQFICRICLSEEDLPEHELI